MNYMSRSNVMYWSYQCFIWSTRSNVQWSLGRNLRDYWIFIFNVYIYTIEINHLSRLVLQCLYIVLWKREFKGSQVWSYSDFSHMKRNWILLLWITFKLRQTKSWQWCQKDTSHTIQKEHHLGVERCRDWRPLWMFVVRKKGNLSVPTIFHEVHVCLSRFVV